MSTEPLSLESAVTLAKTLRNEVSRAVFGQNELITEALCALLAGGHILVTGAPGLAKTTLVRVISRHLGMSFGRVQFTPDLLPSDILGSDILNIDADSGRRQFEFSKGPIFVHLLLADEINRASPRTQSALLEAMQERSVTIGGGLHRLPLPFMVFATQNPFESEGTFPLPEAQLDRFLLHTLVDYPDTAAEELILQEHAQGKLVGEQFVEKDGHNPSAKTASLSEIVALMERVSRIKIEGEIITAIKELVRSTRPQDELCPEPLRNAMLYGAGPRAGIALISVTRALALLQQEETVRWSHVRRLAKPVLRHRMRLTSQALRDEWSEDKVVDLALQRIEEKYTTLSKGV